MLTRVLGHSGIEVSALGMGCWAIGGPYWEVEGDNRNPMGWGAVDDRESIRAIHAATDLGVTFFDTADSYGCGHSEEILGQALQDRRNRVAIATKFGSVFDAAKQEYYPQPDLEITGEFIRSACEASLRRLGTDVIDLYQLHHGDYDLERLPEVVEALEDLVRTGKIRAYGWSTDDLDRAKAIGANDHCAAIQHRLHVLRNAPEMLALCDELDVASINRQPLAAGLLSGKFSVETKITDPHDGRNDWNMTDEPYTTAFREIEALKEVLTSDGRSLVQGCLAWIWAQSDRTIPIPGFKNRKQAEENAGALAKGPLTPEQAQEVSGMLARTLREGT